MAGVDRTRLKGQLLRSCLIFVVFAIASWFVMTRLLAGVREPPRNAFTALAAFFLALGAFSFWGLLTGGGRTQHSRKALLQRFRDGGPVADGDPIISSGVVRSEGGVLKAPLSGTPCVAYFYRMYYWAETLRRGRPVQMPVYWGVASLPFALEGPRERRHVRAAPRLQNKPVPLEGEATRSAARSWIASTSFTAEDNAVLGSVASAFTILGEMLTDEDGATRRDWRLAGSNRNPSDLLFEEMTVPVGQQAAVCGTWSQTRNAIVAGDGLNGVLGVTVSPGGPESIAEDAVANKSMLTYLVTATLLTAAGLGIAWVAERLFPA